MSRDVQLALADELNAVSLAPYKISQHPPICVNEGSGNLLVSKSIFYMTPFMRRTPASCFGSPANLLTSIANARNTKLQVQLSRLIFLYTDTV